MKQTSSHFLLRALGSDRGVSTIVFKLLTLLDICCTPDNERKGGKRTPEESHKQFAPLRCEYNTYRFKSNTKRQTLKFDNVFIFKKTRTTHKSFRYTHKQSVLNFNCFRHVRRYGISSQHQQPYGWLDCQLLRRCWTRGDAAGWQIRCALHSASPVVRALLVDP